MNEYTFSDLRIGMEEKFSYTVTQEKQDLFTELSGDINPMHLDADYANKVLARTNGGGYLSMVCSRHPFIRRSQEFTCLENTAFYNMWKQPLSNLLQLGTA